LIQFGKPGPWRERPILPILACFFMAFFIAFVSLRLADRDARSRPSACSCVVNAALHGHINEKF
jgi:hypothetical protein